MDRERGFAGHLLTRRNALGVLAAGAVFTLLGCGNDDGSGSEDPTLASYPS